MMKWIVRWLKFSLIGLDQFANAFLLFGYPDETISSRAYREKWRLERVINLLFFWDRDHCKTSMDSERENLQLPEELRNADHHS